MTVLVVAVHPDDETLGCGGTLLKHLERGDKIYWLIATKPSTQYGYTDLQAEQAAKQVEAVATAYGFSKTFKLGLPSTGLHHIDFSIIIGKISDVINLIQPEIVYMNNRSDIHTDHQIIAKAIFSCTKSFRYSFIKRILMFECISETEIAPPLPENAFLPNTYSDITRFIERKIEIMRLYKTEIQIPPLPRSEENIRALARYRGSCCCVDYAEAFMLIREVF